MKKGIISKNIVLNGTHQNSPIYGIILIEGDLIKDIIYSQETTSPSQLLEHFHEWNPIDFSNYVISPGLIDLNVRKEFESYQSLTKAAISGGVTFLLQSKPYYGEQQESSEANLYCDIGKLATTGPNESIQNYCSSDIFGFYLPLYKPSPNYPSQIPDLSWYFSKVKKLNMPLFIHPTIPQNLMFHISSPLHKEPFPKRCTKPRIIQSFNIFSAALPEDIVDSDSYQSEESSEQMEQTLQPKMLTTQKCLNMKFLGMVQEDIKSEQSRISFSSQISYPVQIKPKFVLKPNRNSDIQKLNQRVKRNSGNLSSICMAEIESYQYKNEVQSLICTPVTDLSLNSENNQIPAYSSSAKIRPPPIITKPKGQPNFKTNYKLYLANSPDTWEMAGIQKVFNTLEQNPCKIHFQNISSAKAINQIRIAKQRYPFISTELTATNIYFNSEKIKENDTRFKNYPVVRGVENQELLFELLKVQSVDCVSSGHANIPKVYKAMDSGNFQCALNGINCLGFTLQSVWQKIQSESSDKENHSENLVKLSKWTSLGPAEVLGIQNQRGSIETGKLADLVVWDPYDSSCIDNTFSENKDTNIFLNQQIRGKVKAVYLRGQLAFDNGVFYNHGQQISNKSLQQNIFFYHTLN